MLRIINCVSILVFTSTQVFTCAAPFSGSPPAAAMLAVMDGKRPPRPNHSTFTDELWTLSQHCWHQDPHSRPDVLQVLQVLLVSSSIMRSSNHWDQALPVRSGSDRFGMGTMCADLLQGETSSAGYSRSFSQGLGFRAQASLPPKFHSPAWDLLISGRSATHERTSLITTIFLECDEIEIVRTLSAGHYDHGKAQAFVDVIDEESFHTFCVRQRTGRLILIEPSAFRQIGVG